MNYQQMTLELIELHYDGLLSRIRQFREFRNKTLVLWGTGAIGNILYHYLKKYGKVVDFFCDNNPEMIGSRITTDAILCKSPEEVLKMKGTDIIIASTNIDEIGLQLANYQGGDVITPPVDMLVFVSLILGDLEQQSKQFVINQVSKLFQLLDDEISKETLYFKIWGWFASPLEMKQFHYNTILTDKQYIPDGIINIRDHSTIVDCGAYCGDTLKFFLDQGIHFNQYFAYELDRDNYERFLDFIDSCTEEVKEKVTVYNLGVGESKGTFHYFSKKNSSLILDTDDNNANGNSVGEIVDLTHHLKDIGISYIKMDIEGTEMLALKGAAGLIKQNVPDCAICIYHKATDLWEIPLFLASCCSKYKFHIRQHADCYFDTVCYATKQENAGR